MRNCLLLIALATLALLFVGCPKKTEPPPLPPEIVEPVIEPEVIEPVVTPEEPIEKKLKLRSINFDYDKYDITPDAKTILTDNAQQLIEYPTIKIQVEGHCDERGTEQYNLSLGQRRADAVRSFLTNYGVTDARLSVISYGEERPLCRESNESCWARNRRAEFVIKE